MQIKNTAVCEAHRARRRGDRIGAECRLLAQSRHPDRVGECPLSGVKRTSQIEAAMSAYDPKRTLVVNFAVSTVEFGI
jgi:hypothetical protein